MNSLRPPLELPEEEDGVLMSPSEIRYSSTAMPANCCSASVIANWTLLVRHSAVEAAAALANCAVDSCC